MLLQVVLVLKHFDSDDEFKLSRLMVSFAHSTYVASCAAMC